MAARIPRIYQYTRTAIIIFAFSDNKNFEKKLKKKSKLKTEKMIFLNRKKWKNIERKSKLKIY
jgi:hypothetical protein